MNSKTIRFNASKRVAYGYYEKLVEKNHAKKATKCKMLESSFLFFFFKKD